MSVKAEEQKEPNQVLASQIDDKSNKNTSVNLKKDHRSPSIFDQLRRRVSE